MFWSLDTWKVNVNTQKLDLEIQNLANQKNCLSTKWLHVAKHEKLPELTFWLLLITKSLL